MAEPCRSAIAGYVIFLLFSILLYVTEITLQFASLVELYSRGEKVWFALIIGLMVVAIFTCQLLSYQWTSSTKNDIFTQVSVALIHAFQLGVLWRYLRLLCHGRLRNVHILLYQACHLRVFHVFFCSLPTLTIQLYIIVSSPSLLDHQLLLPAACATAISASWTLAIFRKRPDDYVYLGSVFSWPSSILQVLWRLGEVTSRTCVIALFAGIHGYWVIMILALHYLTMLVWLIVAQSLQNPTKHSAQIAAHSFISAYVYMFSYLNVVEGKSKYRVVIFYIIMLLENGVLLALWLTYDDRVNLHIPISVSVAVGYVFGILCSIIYYNCFHSLSSTELTPDRQTEYLQGCMGCEHLCCGDDGSIQQESHPKWCPDDKAGDIMDGISDLASDFSSASKHLSPQINNLSPPPIKARGGGAHNNAAFSHPIEDQRAFNVVVHQQGERYYKPMSPDSQYETGSDFIWDDFVNKATPDLVDDRNGQPAKDHHRSDSGFSFSNRSASHLSVPPLPDQTYQQNGAEDSDFSVERRQIQKARMRALLYNRSIDALHRRRALDDLSESDVISYSSATSHPSSLPSQLHTGRRYRFNHSGVAAKVKRSSKPAKERQLTFRPGKSAPRTNPHHRRRNSDPEIAVPLDVALEQIIQDVSRIAQNLSESAASNDEATTGHSRVKTITKTNSASLEILPGSQSNLIDELSVSNVRSTPTIESMQNNKVNQVAPLPLESPNQRKKRTGSSLHQRTETRTNSISDKSCQSDSQEANGNEVDKRHTSVHNIRANTPSTENKQVPHKEFVNKQGKGLAKSKMDVKDRITNDVVEKTKHKSSALTERSSQSKETVGPQRKHELPLAQGTKAHAEELAEAQDVISNIVADFLYGLNATPQQRTAVEIGTFTELTKDEEYLEGFPNNPTPSSNPSSSQISKHADKRNNPVWF